MRAPPASYPAHDAPARPPGLPPALPRPPRTVTPPTTPLVTRCAEVESWVMQAISAGLLIAKMNQVSSEPLPQP